MEDLLKLTAFSVCMLVGSYLAGSVPLAFTFAEVSVLANRLCNIYPHPAWRRKRGDSCEDHCSVLVFSDHFFYLFRTNFDWCRPLALGCSLELHWL